MVKELIVGSVGDQVSRSVSMRTFLSIGSSCCIRRQYQSLVDQLVKDIHAVSPETELRPVLLDIKDPWDFGEMYSVLHDFARAYPFDPDNEDYLLHITTGTHVGADLYIFAD